MSVCVIVVYGLKETDAERQMFWNDLDMDLKVNEGFRYMD